MTNNSPKGLFWLGVTILIWGAYMPVGKVVSQAIDPYWITGIRYLFSGVFLAIIVAAVEGPASLAPPRKDLAALILLGALGSAGFGLFSYLGVRLTRPEHAAAITVLTPINVAIWRAIQARALPPRNVVLAAIAVVGLTVTGQTEFLQGIGGPIAWFSVCSGVPSSAVVPVV